MLQRTIPVGHALAPESLTFEEPGNAAWAATVEGALVTVRLLDGAVSQLGGGYRHPVGVVPMHDGLTVAIVERTGRIWLARRDQAERGRAQLIADLSGSALAARRHPDAGKLLVLTTRRERGGNADPTIFAVDLAQGAIAEVTHGLTHARTFVADDSRRQLVVLSVTPSGARKLSVVSLDGGAVTPVPGSIGDFDTIVLAPDATTAGVIGVSVDATSPGKLDLIHLDGAPGASMNPALSIVSMTRWGSLLLLASGRTSSRPSGTWMQERSRSIAPRSPVRERLRAARRSARARRSRARRRRVHGPRRPRSAARCPAPLSPRRPTGRSRSCCSPGSGPGSTTWRRGCRVDGRSLLSGGSA